MISSVRLLAVVVLVGCQPDEVPIAADGEGRSLILRAGDVATNLKAVLRANEKVRFLGVQNSAVLDRRCWRAIGELRGVREFQVRGRLSDDGPLLHYRLGRDVLRALGTLENLKIVDLVNVDVDVTALLTSMPDSVEVLRLTNVKGGIASLEFGVDDGANLRVLSLDGIRVNGRTLGSIRRLAHLESLSLSLGALPDGLTALAGHPALRDLFVVHSQTRIGRADLQAVAQCPRLRFLGLKGTALDVGAVVGLKHTASIGQLSLGRGRLSAEGAQTLAEVSTLKAIDLNQMTLEEGALAGLLRSPILDRLSLERIGESDVRLLGAAEVPNHLEIRKGGPFLEALRRARPELHIREGG